MAIEKYKEALVFHKAFVDKVLENKREELTDEFICRVLGIHEDSEYFYGKHDLEVVWINVGSIFRIHEYDGFETLILAEDDEYSKA